MIQFSEAEAKRLRAKAKKEPYIIALLQEQSQHIFKNPIIIPEKGIANWGLYYYCKKCSVALSFNRQQPFNHVCPSCNTVYTGEPFDSTWWGFINTENYNGAYHMGLLYLLTEDKCYAQKTIEVLLGYATYYIDYEVHGDIPYNGPGKAEAQTLNEAIFIRTLGLAYDLVQDCMSGEEKDQVRDKLLIPGAEFLVKHRHNQLHNHEVINNSAIAVIGILYDRQDLIQFALYEKYGLIYQLEEGVLEDKVWFENSFGYHFYALASFLTFEKFALYTQHSHIHHSHYREMLEVAAKFMQPDLSLPMLNDTNYGHHSFKGYQLMEFVYKHTGSLKLLQILNEVYHIEGRRNLEAFFYGVDTLEVTAPIELSVYHTAKGSGHTVLRGKDNRYLLFRHGPYGGEHDHYDRLGISYLAHNERISPDLGTTGYGALLHYDYYKNTGTHNTVMINEENQMPAAGKGLRFEIADDITYIEAEVDFGAPYTLPDSFTIKQWDEESYTGVRMIRKIAWADTYMVDVFVVEGVNQGVIDWCMHFCGKRTVRDPREQQVKAFSDKKPFKYLNNVTVLQNERHVKTNFEIGKAKVNVFTCLKEGELFYGEGPDNPSLKNISYMIERVRGNRAVFFNVIESYQGQETILNVDFIQEGKKVEAIIHKKDKKDKIVFEL